MAIGPYCSSTSISQQVQQSVQQQFQPKDLGQYVKESAAPQTQQSNELNTTGHRGRTLNVTA